MRKENASKTEIVLYRCFRRVLYPFCVWLCMCLYC